MKMTMQLTLDGLRRALRWKAIDLAERVQQGYLPDGPEMPRAREEQRRAAALRGEEHIDDRGRG